MDPLYNLEGIVIKRKDTPYQPGKRSWSWQKVIHWKEAEVVVTGYRKTSWYG
ncbi:hypothetical protein CLV97_13315 [Planifilum fimeticola]|uniref:ATP-dependent DNA ligase family profile domain-containing protein n=1 Tax=Planifilum fimeticola TaxID=201975 RepID=A0A2T0LB95_9BACL|nr:ATP-dependent DNA ligase [Planifilum fimeticola]PRX38914.1 hypothetical protein CLV97_13315 [Planifilum fimeticola]